MPFIKKFGAAVVPAAVVALASVLPAPVYAADPCKVLTCLAHPENYQMVPDCLSDVAEAFAEAKRTQSWPGCPDAKNANNSYAEVKRFDVQYHYNKKGQREGVKSVNGTVDVYIEGELKHQYPF